MLKGTGLSIAMLFTWSALALAAPLKAIVFDLEPVDSSFDGTAIPPDRLKRASVEIRKALADSAQVTLVDPAPEAAAIEKSLPLRSCNGCDLDIAKRLGADLEITTALQRTSDVIIGFSGSVRDVRTGKVLRSGLVDVRGSSDDLWRHGVKFLVKERLLDPPLPPSEEALRGLVDKPAPSSAQ